MAVTSVELLTPEAQAAGARSAIYRALAQGFRTPTDAARVAGELREAVGGLPYALSAEGIDGVAGSADLDQAYLELFEVGGGHGAPCFLYEGEHGGGRMKVLDDVLRFYHYFGLRLSEERRERPDHLATELEFLHALSFKEASVLAGGGDPTPLRQAQRDFLRFHLVPFATAVAERLGASGAPFYPALASLAASLCQADRAYLA
jgi:DMSO reductase family type II enzyme chaperone